MKVNKSLNSADNSVSSVISSVRMTSVYDPLKE